MTTITANMPTLYSGGYEIESGGGKLDWLRRSDDLLDNVAALRQRIAEDGYLYLPGLLDGAEVLAARRSIIELLQAEGAIDPAHDSMQAIANPGWKHAFKPNLPNSSPPLFKLLYGGRMIEFFNRFLGGPTRHFDYTWLRTVPPGRGTPSHCDIVYMGRGTHRLYTCWTPLGDIDFAQGGLMVLEGSHRNDRLRNTYGKYDVDTYCENRPEIHGWKRSGHLTKDVNRIRRTIGGCWRTAEYRAGDVLIFTPFTVHASLDNRSNRIRLSTDSRYQLASEPADERWIGPNPIAHGPAGKRGRIC